MILSECKKLLRQRWLVCLILLLFFVNIGRMINEQYQVHQEQMEAVSFFKQYEEETKHLEREEAVSYLNEKMMKLSDFQLVQLVLSQKAGEELLTTLLEGNPALLEQYKQQGYEENPQRLNAAVTALGSLLSQYSYAAEYDAYLQSIQDRYDQMLENSFYEGRPYAQALGKKTTEDFAALKGTTLQIGIEWGVEALMREQVTSLLLLILVAAICVVSVSQDRANQLFGLLRSCRHGHERLIVVKFFVVFLFTTLLCLLFYGTQILIAWKLYGLGDVSRPMQSVRILHESARCLTLGEFLVDYYIRSSLAILVLAAVTECLLLMVDSMLTALAVLSVGVIICVMGYQNVMKSSGNAWVHFLNPVAWFLEKELYTTYWNIRLFGRPVDALEANAWLQGILAGMSVIGGTFVLGKWMPGKRKQSIGVIRRTLQNLRERLWYPSSTLLQEWKKQLFHNYIFWILIASIFLLFFSVRTRPVEFGVIEKVYQEYAKKHEGVANEALLEALQQEKELFDTLRLRKSELEEKIRTQQITQEQYSGMKEAIDNLLKNEAGLDRAIDQANALVSWGNEHKKELFFTDDSIGMYLFENQSSDLYRGAVLLLLFIALVSGIFPGERTNDMQHMLLCTKNGQMPLFLAKCLLGSLIAATIAIAGMFSHLYSASKMYGFSLWEIPIQSFSQAQNCFLPVSIGAYFLGIIGLQMIGMIGLCCCFLAISVKMKNRLYAMIAGIVIFVLPVVAAGAGVLEIFEWMSGRIFLSTTQILYQGVTGQAINLLLLLLAAGGFLLVAWNVYHKNGNRKRKQIRRVR